MDEMGFHVIKKLNNQDDFEDYRAKEAMKEKKEQADEKQMSNKDKCSEWLSGFLPDDEPIYEPLSEEDPVYEPLPQEEPTYEPLSEEQLIRNRLRKYKCLCLTKELIGELQNLFWETLLKPNESGETCEVAPIKEKGSGSAGWLED
ncbi:hypothetical protein RJT34_12746 [Clitoria ternatea]|uniref:Uncharacterized protein n=1 Tax=Clitoria ternatea TaxID=43366 RepID=A0AAN9JMC6_CLITE